MNNCKLTRLPTVICCGNKVFSLHITRDWTNRKLTWFIEYRSDDGGFRRAQDESLDNAADKMLERLTDYYASLRL